MPEPKNHLDFEEVDFVSFVPAGDNPDARAVLIYKSADDPRNPTAEAGSPTVGDMTTKDAPTVDSPAAGASAAPDAETMAKYLEAITKQNELLVEQNAALVKALEDDAYDDDPEDDPEGDEDPDGDPVEKTAPVDGADLDDILKANPVLAEHLAKLEKQAKDADKIAKAERDARLDVEFAKRAKALDGLGEPEGEVAKTLRKAFDQLDVDTYVAVEKLLVKAATVADSDERAMFKEQGTAAGADEPGDKFSALLAKASQPGQAGLTPADITEAVLSDPSIYRDSLAAMHMNGAAR